MVNTKHRQIRNFNLEIDEYRKFKHDYEPSNICEMPVKWHKAKDFYVFDDKGNKWIDMTSGIFVTNAGHSNKFINKAIKDQIDSDLTFAYQYNTDIRRKFVEKLLQISPPHFNKVVLVNSGSEATDAAYRLIKLWGKKFNKKHIITFQGSYHGRVLGSDFLGGTDNSTDWCNFSDGDLCRLPFPMDGDELDVSKLPDLDNIAAVFLETYQGWSASQYPKKYLDALYNICKKHNILFCVDEVQSGFYRMGTLYGYMTYGEYKPDIVCLGKGLTSSLPLSAVLSTRDIIDLEPSANLSSTHAGNAVCCAAALANLEFLTDYNFQKQLVERVKVFEKRSSSLLKFESVLRVNVEGMVAGIIMDDTPRTNKIVDFCVSNGVLPVWTKRESIKLGPPLTITIDAINEAFDIVEQGIKKYG
jgi:4-aminobutyrate aminotransferase/(S)-3-amino-2-methylpropionate transaminase